MAMHACLAMTNPRRTLGDVHLHKEVLQRPWVMNEHLHRQSLESERFPVRSWQSRIHDDEIQVGIRD